MPSFKPGTLPIPRQIFKQPYKHQVYTKPRDTGYAGGIVHPKGTTRGLIRQEVRTPAKRLKQSAHEPTRKFTEEEVGRMDQRQFYKVKNATLRRQFLKESYATEVERLEKREKYQKRLAEERKEAELESAKHERSKAELFTMPTVESYLKGKMMKQRTPEEKEALKFKREANRLAEKRRVGEARAEQLLELYNASANFAVTEDKLKALVDEAFSERKQEEIARFMRVQSDRLGVVPSTLEFETSVGDIILGKVNQGPTYGVVEDTLSGFNAELTQEAAAAKAEIQSQKRAEAEEKQRKLRELQDEIDKKEEA